MTVAILINDTIVEILYGEKKDSIEWCLLSLIFEYGYTGPIKDAEIIKSWNGEDLQFRIIAESDGLCNEQTRDNMRVLSEYDSGEEFDTEPLSPR